MGTKITKAALLYTVYCSLSFSRDSHSIFDNIKTFMYLHLGFLFVLNGCKIQIEETRPQKSDVHIKLLI